MVIRQCVGEQLTAVRAPDVQRRTDNIERNLGLNFQKRNHGPWISLSADTQNCGQMLPFQLGAAPTRDYGLRGVASE